MIDDLGDRMKSYERANATKLDPSLPMYVRIDGRGFSKPTKKIGLEKPRDQWFDRLMA